MDLIGSYHALGYTVEAYFPAQDAPDAWTLWVIREGRVVGEFTIRMVVDSVYGMDQITMQRLEVEAEVAIREVAQREIDDRARCEARAAALPLRSREKAADQAVMTTG